MISGQRSREDDQTCLAQRAQNPTRPSQPVISFTRTTRVDSIRLRAPRYAERNSRHSSEIRLTVHFRPRRVPLSTISGLLKESPCHGSHKVRANQEIPRAGDRTRTDDLRITSAPPDES